MVIYLDLLTWKEKSAAKNRQHNKRILTADDVDDYVYGTNRDDGIQSVISLGDYYTR